MDDKIIVTVSGVDNIGIVAKITAVFAQYEVNIEDIKQTLMQGHFVMFMLCDIEKSELTFKELKNALIEEGNKIEVVQEKKEEVLVHDINTETNNEEDVKLVFKENEKEFENHTLEDILEGFKDKTLVSDREINLFDDYKEGE